MFVAYRFAGWAEDGQAAHCPAMLAPSFAV
jgi:hypothetical protein